MTRSRPRCWLALACLAVGAPAHAAVLVRPAAVVLDNPESSQQLLVKAVELGPDLTRTAKYTSANPAIATVDANGLIAPRAEGKTEIVVQHGAESVRVPVEVRGLKQPTPISFEHQILPILTKASCNSGGCHGKAEGQNGFKLSVFGFDPPADYQALLMEGRGRRLFASSPAHSLFVGKSTGRVPHGGGRKIEPDGIRYQRLVRWITEGAQYQSAAVKPVVSIVVEPAGQVLTMRGTQQLQVTAIDADGVRRCVTTEAEYESNATTIAGADGRGWVQAADVPGEAAILVRYMGHVAVCRVTIPQPGVTFPRPPEANFIDKLVWDRLTVLGIAPTEIADDATFLRRVHLDTIGTLPTAEEARAFLASKEPNKRAKLIDALLERPEYADFWAQKWSDILRVDRDAINAAGAVAMTRWLRKSFAENKPYDRMAREVLTAQGSTAAEGPAAFYKVLGTPEIMSRSVSQVFLGVRIECAQCHHHPSEKWGQDDYFALAGFFSGVGRKNLPTGVEAIFATVGKDLDHPRTKKPVATKALGAAVADFTNVHDRRRVFADWMTAPENAFFATAAANRIWAHYFGRGLVEPLDDIRATNPASNEPLMRDLAKHLRDGKYDMKAFTRTVLNSRVYQLSSLTNASNAKDEQNFSHAVPRAMPAEVLLDAISQVTGAPEKFNGWPEGVRAIQVWDNRMPSYFLKIFGRPVRATVCECERSNEPSMAQALHLMNSSEITAKVGARGGVARRLADSKKTPTEIADELFLATIARLPTDAERAAVLKTFDGADRREVVEDLLWSLLNKREFVYNR